MQRLYKKLPPETKLSARRRKRLPSRRKNLHVRTGRREVTPQLKMEPTR